MLVALAVAGTAASSNLWTAITGHTQDLISRTTADQVITGTVTACLLYTSPSPRD